MNFTTSTKHSPQLGLYRIRVL